jgi:molybdopterin-synthase adenylyltransferase
LSSGQAQTDTLEQVDGKSLATERAPTIGFMTAERELARYHRQMLLPGIGRDGQEKLLGSSALVVGCGALGCVAAEGLVRAGVGRVVIVDRDVVEETNLQRQVLFDETDAREGRPKAEAGARRLRLVNSEIRIDEVVADVNARNVEGLLRGMDVVVDGTDNFQTRYLVNDACVKLGVPLVYGGVVGTVGMSMTIVPEGSAAGSRGAQGTPCLRCVFPEPPPVGSAPTCDTVGVLGAMVGIVGSMQVAEAMKVLLGKWELIKPVLRQMDIWKGAWREISLAGIDRSSCACCGQRKFEFLDGSRGDGASGETSLCGTNAVQVLPMKGSGEIDLGELARRLGAQGIFAVTNHLLRGRLERERGGAIVGG